MPAHSTYLRTTPWVTGALLIAAAFGALHFNSQDQRSRTVTIEPARAALEGGQSRQFRATISGDSRPGVIWSVNGFEGGNAVVGTISPDGVYSAPVCPELSSVSIQALARSDSSARSTATVTLAAPADGERDRYISPTGSDANDGSRCKPWATISHADNIVRPGSIVHIAPGTYSGDILTQRSGTAEERIAYISDTKWAAKLRYGGSEASWTVNGNYIDIVGFDVSGTGRLGILNFGSHNKISGNYVHDIATDKKCSGAGGAGINNANYFGKDNEVSDNVVGNIGVAMLGSCPTIHGIYVANSGATVTHNIVYGAAGVCIQQWHAASHSQILNNTVFNCKVGILIGNGDKPGRVVSDYNVVANNIVYDNKAYGIIEFCNTKFNCTGKHNRYVNNLVYGNSKDLVLRNGLESVGTIREDPLFVSYRPDGRGDYSLKPRSPAVNAAASEFVLHGSRRSDVTSDLGAVQSGLKREQISDGTRR